ncbi:hypothetical protein [Cellulosimicrobium protaetiae]|uniref:Uncharacterized protein n=1 Tax=Cellulosimicrobium protaetiae TaxID=2587808 RepID=A0A6M5UKD7_9MICO|nr:hypothetical protein [Cellulosimicrobium protaetiae]QJW37139.1 hypothetical protein FIC82_014035 [Cellulosimicrobium protaetiae]
MIAIGLLDRQGFEDALAHAGALGAGGDDLAGLSAPADGGFLGKLSEVWESIERALREAFVHGAERATAARDAAVALAERCMEEAGRRARDVHQALLSRLQDYVGTLVDTMLARLRPAFAVGGSDLTLDSVDVNQRISFTGSLKAAITEVVALTSSGELTVSAGYRVSRS